MSARSENPVFVIEGTPAWDAWLKVVSDPPPPAAREIGDEMRQGAYFPTLFPPAPEREKGDEVLFSFVVGGKVLRELWIPRDDVEFASRLLLAIWNGYARAQKRDPDS